MKIKNLAITSPSALDFEFDFDSPVCLLCGEHSALALDLIRQVCNVTISGRNISDRFAVGVICDRACARGVDRARGLSAPKP